MISNRRRISHYDQQVEKTQGQQEQDAEKLQKSDLPQTTMMAPPAGQIYFYHPDHLGTSTFLTDVNGQPYQFFLNLPFGETMAEQHSQTEDYESPYKFNGKELDPETGYYYYGARYYDPRTSIWLSTDPLMEKYPNINPYVYCVQNPVKFVDPTGMAPETDYVKNGKLVHTDGKDNGTVYIVNDNYEFNGDVKDLTENSKLLYYKYRLQGTYEEAFAYVKSVAKENNIDLEEQKYILKTNESSDYLESGPGGTLIQNVSDGLMNFIPDHPDQLNLTIAFKSKEDKSIIYSSYYNLLNSIEHETDHFAHYKGLYHFYMETGKMQKVKNLNGMLKILENSAISIKGNNKVGILPQRRTKNL